MWLVKDFTYFTLYLHLTYHIGYRILTAAAPSAAYASLLHKTAVMTPEMKNKSVHTAYTIISCTHKT